MNFDESLQRMGDSGMNPRLNQEDSPRVDPQELFDRMARGKSLLAVAMANLDAASKSAAALFESIDHDGAK